MGRSHTTPASLKYIGLQIKPFQGFLLIWQGANKPE
jgi:hypothetical protein